jgi:hypothetical protein
MFRTHLKDSLLDHVYTHNNRQRMRKIVETPVSRKNARGRGVSIT